jgi:nitrile hydratase subunit beta
MRAPSDYGGRPAGPIDRTEHAPTLRDKRVDAMKAVVQRRDPRLTSDASRRAQEELSQALYDTLPYYDRWLIAFRRNLVELGYLSDAEVDARMAEIARKRAGAG